jgi:hypothetical protein
MAVSGLVVTLSDDAAAAAALSKLLSDPRITVGDRFGRRLAAVAETPSVHADHLLFDELRSTRGIVHVDVAFVHFDAEADAGRSPHTNRPVEVQDAHD